jgi:hypothetical protein
LCGEVSATVKERRPGVLAVRRMAMTLSGYLAKASRV